MEQKIDEVLKRNQLSVTESRRKILHLFINQPDALAHADIEKKAGEKFDRVTIYRTLQTFVEKGIIHTIPTTDNSIRYALCKDNCSEGHHHDNHVHFICLKCGKTECIDDVNTPDIKLPEGYSVSHVEAIINGVCKACRNK